jgi:hypothetical protein
MGEEHPDDRADERPCPGGLSRSIEASTHLKVLRQPRVGKSAFEGKVNWLGDCPIARKAPNSRSFGFARSFRHAERFAVPNGSTDNRTYDAASADDAIDTVDDSVCVRRLDSHGRGERGSGESSA